VRYNFEFNKIIKLIIIYKKGKLIMKKYLISFSLLLFVLLSCSKSEKEPMTEKLILSDKAPNSVAYFWGKVALEATANDTEKFNPRPTISSRMLGIVFASVFDAWSRFDDKAMPLYLKDVERVAPEMRTLSNKEIAISYAAYNTLCEYYISEKMLFDKSMKELGLDPNDKSMDKNTAVGIGNLAAKTIIEARKTDGSNQYGNVDGNKMMYGDYTNYEPVNPIDELRDINKWQCKYFETLEGEKYDPGCLSPHWYLVKPLLLDSSSQFRAPAPPLYGTEKLNKQIEEVVDLQANITPKQKALVEFMRDGPKSVQQAGHWMIFAQDVSRRDSHSIDDDVKMYFLVTAVAMDGFIACWDSKMHYDYARPFALIHKYYEGKTIYGWKGEGKGWGEMKGEDWRPYSPKYFLCPPFPSYVSGHSTISGGCGEVLKLFKQDDYFGEEVRLVPGILTEPDNLSDTITLEFPTFTETAEMAGISRVLGGYHIQEDNIEGLILGRKIARDIYKKYLKLVGEE